MAIKKFKKGDKVTPDYNKLKGIKGLYKSDLESLGGGEVKDSFKDIYTGEQAYTVYFKNRGGKASINFFERELK